MELDVVAYDPASDAITHVEPSLDADKWAKREECFRKKFEAGKKYILKDVLPWLPQTTEIVQKAIFPSAGDNRRLLAGAQVQTVDEVIAESPRLSTRFAAKGSRAGQPSQSDTRSCGRFNL